MSRLIIFLFWVLASIPAIALIIYPLLMKALSLLLAPLKTPVESNELPPVALLITAYNEEKVIGEKIKNALALDYPANLLTVIVHTDGSKDGTDSIIAQFNNPSIIHLKNPVNRGKTVSLNDAVAAADAPILVYSDANSMYHSDTIRKLVRWFQHDKVGCVCGRLKIFHRGAAKAQGESRYWDWDTRLKICEGKSGRLLGANGAIFALRRWLAVYLPGEQSNDMVLPIVARLRGFKTVYDPEAIAEEEAAETAGGEFRRKSRIIARGLSGVVFSILFAFRDARACQSPFFMRLFVLLQLIAKKLCRYLAFPAIFFMMVLGAFLPIGFSFWIAVALWGAVGFSAAAAILQMLLKKKSPRLLDASYLFAVIAASFAGLYRFLLRRNLSRWESMR
ncbi:MAG: Poly-beta-1,6-N-acetyl-D-glucosamine synthase [candidate division BRC1 bacterium ADurb.Bin183]|nr:MAG: Poly-beta-1,6-N-acetyl-D-glucosamine synthase [candidate division BRC1 bacterium ADurb.Bin183]